MPAMTTTTPCYSLHPFTVMADRLGNRLLRWLKAGEFLFGQQFMAIVIRNQHPLAADEELRPFEHLAQRLAIELQRLRQLRLLAAVVPGQLQRRLFAACRIFIAGDAPSRRADRIER